MVKVISDCYRSISRTRANLTRPSCAFASVYHLLFVCFLLLQQQPVNINHNHNYNSVNCLLLEQDPLAVSEQQQQLADPSEAYVEQLLLQQEEPNEQHLSTQESNYEQQQQQASSNVAKERSNIRSAKFKLINFKTFRKVFHKHYSSLRELSFRLLQFVANSARVFKSMLAYFNNKSTYYLRLNQYSDLTPEEKRSKLGVKSNDDFEQLSGAKLRRVEHYAAADSPIEQEAAAAATQESARRHPLSRIKRENSENDNDNDKDGDNDGEDRGPGWFGFLFKPNKSDTSDRKSEAEISFDIDWRPNRARQPVSDLNCLNEPAIDQGECGCCYAIAMVRLFEWLHCNEMKKKKAKAEKGEEEKEQNKENNEQMAAGAGSAAASLPVSFSEQYVINCGRPFELHGCTKGNLLGVRDFIRSSGLLDANLMPYEAKEGQCPFNSGGQDNSSGGQDKGSLALRHEQAIVPSRVDLKMVDVRDWSQELRKHPLIVYMQISRDFYDYGGGLFEPDECDVDIGHFMLLIGSGYDHKERRHFWLLANTFGPQYGESGYIRVLARSNNSARDTKSKSINCIAWAVRGEAEFQQ